MTKIFRGRGSVSHTEELRRIIEIPRRTWSEEDGKELAEKMTKLLKKPDGAQSLRPIQALALHDIGIAKGFFGPIRVGGGKTLISLLAPYILQARRPLLLLPAGLVEKTNRDLSAAMKHWNIPRNIRILSYDKLSRVAGQNELEFYRPDVIFADEVHRLKNKKAAVTRRVARYMHNNPETTFLAASGTVTKRSIKDFAHILRWCLKENAPIPGHEGELLEWSDCLDEKVDELYRKDPGALRLLMNDEEKSEENELTATRRAYQRRLTETLGVVATGDDQVACSLYISPIEYDVNEATEKNFDTIKQWVTPDGWDISEGVVRWAHERQLSLGFHHIWVPRPPQEWMNKRKNWKSYVRETLSHSRTLDSELQVVNMCRASKTPVPEYVEWMQIKNTFVPNTEVVWHDDSALNVCAEWAKKHAGIIWTEHTFFARELSRRTGVVYYGAKGLDSRGNYIESADKTKPVIASIAANKEGRNLQFQWSKNLVTSIPTSGLIWEQMVGRTHRDLQEADTVTVDYLVGCKAHQNAFAQACEDAKYQEIITGQNQKLVYADKILSEKQPSHAKDYRWL